jgi:membrane-bound inhibitor of C-type lysozyme
MSQQQAQQRQSRTRLALAALLLTSGTLIAPHGARADTAIRARYLCQGRFDATDVTALFFNKAPGAVVLLVGSEGATRLPQLPAASGARYGDGNEEFWIKGDQATWTLGRAPAMTCKTGVSSGSRAPTR